MMNSERHIFLQVVESGSLKRAAEALGLDPSVVSRKVAALEARLQTKLLNRSTRRSNPTEAGDEYYREMRVLLDQEAALETRIMGLGEQPIGRLTVAAPVDFGARFVAPVLSAMQQDFPELAIELKLGSQFANLAEEGVDVAIRIGQLADSSLVAQRLGHVSRTIVAANAFFNERDKPNEPHDLAALPFIFYLPGQRQETIALSVGTDEQRVVVRGQFSANSVTAIRQLVLDGRGLHHGPAWAFENELASGEVVSLLPGYKLRAFPVQAVMVSRTFVPAKTRVFTQRMRDFFVQEPSILTDYRRPISLP